MSSASPSSRINKEPKTGGDQYDLICIGFGPASLAIAVALRDLHVDAQILFLERQPHFAWHSGMLIPTAKMQISFLKDLATFRDPRSHFTFLNYLKHRGRLEAFTNLGTFFPLREEFNDYLSWAAGHFEGVVKYSMEAQSVQAIHECSNKRANGWLVTCLNRKDNSYISLQSKRLVVAIGGSPKLPRGLQSFSHNIMHSSQYLQAISNDVWKDHSTLRFAVIGAGQSAAEIFEDLIQRFPQAHIKMYIASSALKPSDDSPFVNEIFNSDRVSEVYSLEEKERGLVIKENRPTNYSVVRPELLDRLYEKMYHQRLQEPNTDFWRFQIRHSRELCETRQTSDGKVDLHFIEPKHSSNTSIVESGFDLVLAATGYTREAHMHLLEPVRHLLEDSFTSVERNYRLKLKHDIVDPECGIWLQGCCEESHGLSDTLLSILAVRGGEIVESVFGKTSSKEVI